MDALATVEVKPLSQKEQQWQRIEERIQDIEKQDIYRNKIDPKVKGAVKGLLAFGFNTIESCAGHLDHGQGFPYIVLSEVEATRKRRDATAAHVMERHSDYERLKDQARQINSQINIKLQKYLEEFYASREMPENLRLVTGFTPFEQVYLRSRGAVAQWNADPAEKARYLTAFQNEMEAFGLFLKEKFFSDDPLAIPVVTL